MIFARSSPACVKCFSYFVPPLPSVPGSAISRSDPPLALKESPSQLPAGGDLTWRPGEGVLRGDLLTGGSCRDLPYQREDGEKDVQTMGQGPRGEQCGPT